MTDDLPTSELQTNAFFDFSNTNFTVDLALEGTSGSAYAGANRNRIISDAIPAVRLPIGANPVGRLAPAGQPDRNINMSTATFENGWPITTGPEAFNWHHSDCKTVAYIFTYQLFNQMVLLGNLQ